MDDLNGLMLTRDKPLCQCLVPPDNSQCPKDATHRIKAVFASDHPCDSGQKDCITCMPHADAFQMFFEMGALKCEQEACMYKVIGIRVLPLGSKEEW